MNGPDPLTAALARLDAALDLLEAAAGRRAASDAVRADRDDELTVMGDDRARMAIELDGALTRLKSQDLARTDVLRRLQQATATIEAVLGSDPDHRADDAPEPA